MTLLQLVNRVLRRLREDEVTDFTADYTTLIVDFLAEVHAEVLDEHDWSSMDYDVQVAAVASQEEYDLSATIADGGGVTNGYTPTTAKSLVRQVEGTPVAYWYDSVSATQSTKIPQVSWEKYVDLYKSDTSQEAIQPTVFALRQDGDGFRLALWPTPDASTGIFEIRFHTPEAVISSESSTVSTTVLAPERPLVLGALYLALNERGEELGEPGNIAEQRYYKALAAAKEADQMNSGRTNKFEFYRD